MAFTQKTILIIHSQQPTNQYSGGGTGVNDSEQYWMRKLAEEIVAELKTTGHDVRLGPTGTSKSTFRENVAWVNKSANAGADLMVSCHSNATSTSGDKPVGIGVYHHPSSSKGRALAEKLVPFLKPVSATGRVYRSTIMVSEVSETKPPALLVEHEFHDYTTGADWIRKASNRTGLAKAYRKWVVSMWGEKTATPVPVVYPATTTLQGRILFFREMHRDPELAKALKQYYDKGAKWDSPRWAEFCDAWDKLDSAMHLDYTVPTNLDDSSTQYLVMLGSGLKDDGTMSAKHLRRLKLTREVALKYPKTKIIVSGGAPKNGVTEAALGKKWLVDNGIASTRIIAETKSASTVGNARYSMAIMKARIDADVADGLKVSYSYAIISDASHLRRAAALFEAAQLQHETDTNTRLGLSRDALIAYKDVATAEAKPSSSARYTNSYHVSILLGITSAYASARKL